MILKLSLSAMALAVLSACGGGGTYEDDKKQSKNEVTTIISLAAFGQDSVKAFVEVETAIAGRSGSFTLAKATTVKYGADTRFVSKLLQAGTYTCGDQLFGDPTPGVNKKCFVVENTSTELKKITDEFNSFTLKTATTISYGINGVYIKKLLQAGTI